MGIRHNAVKVRFLNEDERDADLSALPAPLTSTLDDDNRRSSRTSSPCVAGGGSFILALSGSEDGGETSLHMSTTRPSSPC